MFVHLTAVSRNSKTGPIPVSTTSADTCPETCPFKNNGCYAGYGPLKLHWDRVTSGERSTPWDVFLNAIRRLPQQQLWRHNQAGDLPGQGTAVDADLLMQLVDANKGKRGFTYTHKPMTPENVALLRRANSAGFTINASANSLSDADVMMDLGLQVVAVVPADSVSKGTTPGGYPFVVCPAQDQDGVNCASCGLCHNADPKRPVIAFRAHGTGKKHIEATLVCSDT